MNLSDQQKGIVSIILTLGLVVAVLGAVLFFILNRPSENFPLSRLTQNQPKSLFLNIESPTSQTEAVDDSVLVKGKTLPNTRVVMFNTSDDVVLQSDQNGNFAGKLLLDPGKNTLTVTSFAENGDEKTMNVEIIYNPKS